jgi:hypothetical protein
MHTISSANSVLRIMRQEKSPPQGGGLDFDAHKRGMTRALNPYRQFPAGRACTFVSSGEG